MKKSDLKSGMLVFVEDDCLIRIKSINSGWFLIINDKMYGICLDLFGKWINLNNYSENLLYKTSKEKWVITKIAEIDDGILSEVLRNKEKNVNQLLGFNILWEREKTNTNRNEIEDIQNTINELQIKLDRLKSNLK